MLSFRICNVRLPHSQRWLSQVPAPPQSGTVQKFVWQKPLGQHTNIRIYNHILRQKVPLVLPNPNMVTWYTCGPTVYDSAHLGHACTYVKVDIIQRILRDYFRINLVTAMNITDVDDKILRKARELGCNWLDISRAYETEFKNDMLQLNVQPPDIKSNVSSNIDNIRTFIQELISKGHAYVAKDYSVYFDVSKLAYYGKLEKVDLNNSGETGERDKRHRSDFALWKAKKMPDEPSWTTSWGGEGRPGWHIECSAIAGLLFGTNLDFHAGGLDLRFPHHENEEAQCCARYQTDQWVNYWMHTGQLHVAGDENKMSKSLGNTISVSELLRHYTADEFRMACLLSNYRNAMLYSDQLMMTARQTLQKFRNFQADISAYTKLMKPLKFLDEGALKAQLDHMVKEFDASLRDDFDTARGLSVLMDQMSSISRCINDHEKNAEQDPAYCLDLLIAAGNFINKAMSNFGLAVMEDAKMPRYNHQKSAMGLDSSNLVTDIINLRGNIRQQARGQSPKNIQLLAVCDELRNVLQHHGIKVRDHEQGSSWVVSAINNTQSKRSG